MAHTFFCQKCGKRFDVDAAMIGRRARCKQCQHTFIIPDRASRSPTPSRPGPEATGPPGVDPFGLDDPVEASPPPRRAPASEFDEEFLPRRPGRPVAKSSRSASRSKAPELRWLETVGKWGLGSGFLLAMLSAGLAFAQMPGAAFVLLILAGIVLVALYATGAIVSIVVPFFEDVVQGLLCIFVPFYKLYYLITRWSVMKRPFAVTMAAGFLGGVTLAAAAVVLPVFAASRKGPMAAAPAGPGLGIGPGIGAGTGRSPSPAPSVAANPGRSGRMRDLLNRQATAKFHGLADILGRVRGLDDARREAGAYSGQAEELANLLERFNALPPPGPTADASPSGAALGQARRRYRGEARRVAAIEGAAEFLAMGNYAFNADATNADRASSVGSPDGSGPDRTDSPGAEGPGGPVARRASANPRSRPRREVATAGADFADRILDDLNSPEKPARKRALGKLANTRPIEDRREEVAAAIDPILEDPDSDGFTRADAAKALAVWGGPKNIPALTRALKDPAFNVRWAVLDALKELRDPGSAPAIAEMLATRDRGKACDALRAIGPEAEDSVLPYLQHEDGFVRMDTCKVLQVIGTEKSVRDLRAIAMKNSGLDSMAARDALMALARRNVNIDINPRKKSRGR